MNGHPYSEYADINGVLPEQKYAPPRMIECDGWVDYIGCCDDCACIHETKNWCKLIPRVSVSLNPRVDDRYTIHSDCPLKLYTSKEVKS
jgi:hypothetical protein